MINSVISNGFGVYFCPRCKGSVWQIIYESNYCFRCGLKLDWTHIMEENNENS